MCANEPMNEYISIKSLQGIHLIDTSKFSPLCLNTPMIWDFVKQQNVLIHILLSNIVTYINPSFENEF